MEKETPEFYKERDIFGLEKQELEVPLDDLGPLDSPELNVVYAGLGRRIGAYLLDVLILFLPILIIEAMLFNSEQPGEQQVLKVVFELLLWTLYYGITESSDSQGTFGKVILGIKVIDEEGNKLSFARAVSRYLTMFISILPLGFGIWAIASDKKGQAWHDRITRCLVIEKRPAFAGSSTTNEPNVNSQA